MTVDLPVRDPAHPEVPYNVKVVGELSVESHIGPPSSAMVLRSFRPKSPGIERWHDVADASEYKMTFELVDADGDGFISAAELKSLMQALGQGITDARS